MLTSSLHIEFHKAIRLCMLIKQISKIYLKLILIYQNIYNLFYSEV